MYARVNADGIVEAQFGLPLDGPPLPPPPAEEGIEYFLLSGPIDWRGKPSETSVMRWNNGAPRWEETATLDQARAIAWELVKAARDAAEGAPFEFEGGMYDPNKENITGAALAAFMAQMAGVTISRRWTLADNSRRTLAGPQLIDLGYKLTTRVDTIHETGRRLRDQLETIMNTPGATPADLYAVTWPTEENNAVE
jgi:hypothetical protein